eukprot:3645533-Amphidinium_carterae.1
MCEATPTRVLWGALPHDAGVHSAALAEDYAVTRLALFAARPMHVYCDCQRTINILREGPRGARWQKVAHAHLWHELWTPFPAPIPCTKVAAHTSWKLAQGNPQQEYIWLGNFTADRYAKWGAYANPGGRAQIQRCEEWEVYLTAWYGFMASQAEQLALGQCTDMDELPVGATRAQLGSEPTQMSGPAHNIRRKRQPWIMPEWMQQLAQRVPPRGQRPVAPVPVAIPHPSPTVNQHVIPKARLNQGHEWALYQVYDQEGVLRCHLLACTLCGAYSQRRVQATRFPCAGIGHDRVGLARQRSRLEQGLHPQARPPY